MELLEKLKELGCIQEIPDPYHSDYRCRYCNQHTRTNLDHTIVHREDCLWLEIETIATNQSNVIVVNDGDVFIGTQLEWENAFFTFGSQKWEDRLAEITDFCNRNNWSFVIK